jgi:hypothetical protein
MEILISIYPGFNVPIPTELSEQITIKSNCGMATLQRSLVTKVGQGFLRNFSLILTRSATKSIHPVISSLL